MGRLFSQDTNERFESFIGPFSHTYTLSQKINIILTSFIRQYLNILIHHLLLAGQNINGDSQGRNRMYNINLVSLRISDLLRSKFKCSDSGFISLLHTMYMMDDNKAMKSKFKLVRVKNKLGEPAKNIIINYLFMGKVQCELQLSVQQPKSK